MADDPTPKPPKAPCKRLKGMGLKFDLGDEEFWLDLSKIELNSEAEDGDSVTFADAVAGGAYKYFLDLGYVQSTERKSLWRYLWAKSSENAEIAFTFAPHGNTVASEDEPHVIGTCKLPASKPKLGGAPKETWQAEARLEVVGDPVLDTGTPTV